MQVTETSAEGLKREFKVVVAAADIDAKVDQKLTEVGKEVRIPGFRPGKVPHAILKQRFGKSVLGEVLEQTVAESANEAITEKDLRPAMQPKIEIDKFEDGEDLEYTMSLEILPEFEINDLKSIELTKYKVPVEDKEIEDALGRLAAGRQETEEAPKDHAAAEGDVVVIDFEGKIDGEAFQGGAAEGHHLQLGSNTFIPGFEDQLVGLKAGDAKDVKITFPADYGAEHLAGKDAVFAVTVKEVRRAKPAEIDDALAKSFGLDDLAALKTAVRDDIENNYNAMARTRLKRELLDALAEGHDFELPPGMVDTEFEAIWQQFEERKKRGELDEDEKDKSDDDLKAEYRTIAERRVRLGLILSEIGSSNEIQVGQDEISRAIVGEAQRYPGREREVMEFYQKNQQARESLRAPLYEDKVIDFILELVKTTEKEITVDELLAVPEDEGEEKKPAGKSASGKSTSDKSAGSKSGKSASSKSSGDKASAKKPAAKAAKTTKAKAKKS